MSDTGTEQDKSELPTPYKLQRAKRRGMVARGMDLGFLTCLAAFSAYVWLFGSGASDEVGAAAQRALASAAGAAATPQALLGITGSLIAAAAKPVFLLAGAVFAVVLVFEIVQTGGVLTAEPLRLDFSRMNPATGLKRLFSVRMLVEAAKNIAKMLVYGALAGLSIRGAITTAAPALVGAEPLAAGLRHDAMRMLSLFLAAALAFAVLDQLIVRRDFLKRMRMSRREVRRESRDREGDPRFKQKRKSLHREFTKASESLRAIKGADVLVTNPTHFAVALKYDPARMHAPMVVSRGAHRFAPRLRRLAFLYGVVIVREPALARALYRCELNQPVPETLYRPVAALYRALRRQAGAPVQGAA